MKLFTPAGCRVILPGKSNPAAAQTAQGTGTTLDKPQKK